ncbi:MAG TPA: YHS domain-containing protein [Planctomycetota bacterium]|nr:YHS domain-containing protein [Planctomycetota bacterium]
MRHALATALVLALAAGCARPRQQRHGADSDARDGNDAAQVTDVVCGMKCPRENAFSTVFGGRTYYFCHDRCMTEFQRNPGKYAEDATGQPGAPEERKPAPQDRNAGEPYRKP